MIRLICALLVLGTACTPPRTYLDLDADGVTSETDCNDHDAGVAPDLPEVCDGKDQDCDGLVDEEPTDPTPWYADADEDGAGDPADEILACERPDGRVAVADDCDDASATANPGEQERCNGVDDDCDSEVDEDDAIGKDRFYRDADGDGQGSTTDWYDACAIPEGYVSTFGDCDDTDPSVHFGSPELCNDRDDDCDGGVDESAIDGVRFYIDEDEDGWGDPYVWVTACEPAAGYVVNGDDCDDSNASINPESVWYRDADGDGWGDTSVSVPGCEQPPGPYKLADGDCDDAAHAVNPGADEIWYDGVDQDCDGMDDYDQDGDGRRAKAHGGDDCNDGDAAVWNLCGSGKSPGQAGRTCRTIKTSYASSGNGLYFVDPDGDGDTTDAFQTYCDMTTDGGGWTLISWSHDTRGGGSGVPYPGIRRCPTMTCTDGSTPDREGANPLVRSGTAFAIAYSPSATRSEFAPISAYTYAGKYQYGSLALLTVVHDSAPTCEPGPVGTFSVLQGDPASLSGRTVYLPRAMTDFTNVIRETNNQGWTIGLTAGPCYQGYNGLPSTRLRQGDALQWGPYSYDKFWGAVAVWVR